MDKTRKARTTAGKKPTSIPQFSDIAEEAAFWDRHEVTIVWDESKSADVRLDRAAQRPITVTLAAGDLQAIERIAAERELTVDSLVTSWIKKQLEAPPGRRRTRPSPRKAG
jgi:hypothetical protein